VPLLTALLYSSSRVASSTTFLKCAPKTAPPPIGVMALLKRPNGRCSTVLPNGFSGFCSHQKTTPSPALQSVSIHFRPIPNGVFAPFTQVFRPTCSSSMPAFNEDDTPCNSREIWYHELETLSEARRSWAAKFH